MDLKGTKLSNRDGLILAGTWQIPSAETTGPIRNTSAANDPKNLNDYLSTNGKTTEGSVVVKEPMDEDDVDQIWERSAHDGTGFFNLKNPNSGLHLTMKTANTLTIGSA